MKEKTRKSDNPAEAVLSIPASPENISQTKNEPEQEGTACKKAAEDSAEQLQKLQEEIEQLRKVAEERNEFLNLLQRVQADFLNYQKRIKREKESWEKYQDENILRELLPTIDSFEQTLKISEPCKLSDDARCVIEGVGLIKREIFRILEKRGVKKIKTIGEKFDANFHEVVGVVEDSGHPENEIIEEVSVGYLLHDRLIRVAKVKIAVKPKETQE
jgi:molecular chaperone GrpE